MVKFTSTVVAASLFAGAALAAPFSRSDDVAVTAREIEALFGREMVEYATRSPHHLKEVVEAVHTVSNVINSRREYLEAREHFHGEHGYTHPHHNNQHPHPHPHYGEHPHPHFQSTEAAPADTPAADPGTNQRRSYYEPTLAVREHFHGEHGYTHPHHNNQHPHPHPHYGEHPHPHFQSTEAAPVDAPAADPGTNQRRSYDDYYSSFAARDLTDGSVDASAASAQPAPVAPVVHHAHPHQHPVHHNANPEAMHRWHDVIAKIHAKQQAAGGHPHQHMHGAGHVHTHSHSHSASASAPASPAADAAPVTPPPVRRSLDFDELYARYADFDDLD